MKRLIGLLIALLLVALAAMPAAAQGENESEGDHVCFGGETLVRPADAPESVVLFGCGARIQSGVHVSRDIVSFGGNVILEEGTRVRGDIVVFGGNLDVGGQVGDDVVVFGGTVTLQPNSVVDGNVQVFGGMTNRRQGATVRGRITSGGAFDFERFRFPVVPIPGNVPPLEMRRVGGLWTGIFTDLVQSFITAVALAALGALVLVFLPTQTEQVSRTAAQSAVPSIGVGCLTFLIAPPLLILLIITCLGIPIAGILGIVLAAAGVFGWIAVSLVLGERLLRALKVASIVPIAAMVVGLFVLWLVTEVPLLGFLIWLFVASLALGAVILTRFGTQPYPETVAGPGALTVPPPPPAPIEPSEPVPPAPPSGAGDAV